MKDQNYVYFLVEYIKGMELFDVIRDIGNIYLKKKNILPFFFITKLRIIEHI